MTDHIWPDNCNVYREGRKDPWQEILRRRKERGPLIKGCHFRDVSNLRCVESSNGKGFTTERRRLKGNDNTLRPSIYK